MSNKKRVIILHDYKIDEDVGFTFDEVVAWRHEGEFIIVTFNSGVMRKFNRSLFLDTLNGKKIKYAKGIYC